MNKQDKNKPGKRAKDVSEQTKQKIIQAAIEVFTRDGFFAAKIRDIASIAGANHSMIIYHFGSKEGLWRAVVDYCHEQYQENLNSLRELVKKIPDPVDMLKIYITSYIRFSIKNPNILASVIFNDSGKSPDREYALKKQSEIHSFTKPLFKKVQDRGYFKWIDHDSFFLYLISLVETPIVGSKFSTTLVSTNIFSEKGIKMHTENVLNFLFHRD